MSWYVEFSIIWQVYFNHERQRLSVLLYFFLVLHKVPVSPHHADQPCTNVKRDLGSLISPLMSDNQQGFSAQV